MAGALNKAKSEISKTSLANEVSLTHKASTLGIDHKVQTLTPTGKAKITSLGRLSDCNRNERDDLFVKKLNQCCYIFDFLDVYSNQAGKKVKTDNLIDLIEYISNDKLKLAEQLYREILHMVGKNIFRPFPYQQKTFDFNEPDEVSEDASWKHLKLVYSFFRKFLDMAHFNPDYAKKYVDKHFLVQVLQTFNTFDGRERQYLKTILHRIYGKLLNWRPFLRQQINNIFLRFVYEAENMNGIGELLEIFGSIINGFALPLKSEHKVFLQKVLLPLHKPSSLYFYHAQLIYCVIQFIDKDPNLGEIVIIGLLRFWPAWFSQKQVMFLNEFEEIFAHMQDEQIAKIQEKLFKKIAECMRSSHFMVSQRALYLWSNDDIVSYCDNNSEVIMKIVFPSLYHISNNHWNSAIITLSKEVLKVFEDMNPKIYKCLVKEYSEEK